MVTKTDATSLAAVPGTEVAIWSLKLMLYIPCCCSRDRGCYMFTKTDDTSLAAVPGTEVAIWSLKLMLYIPSCCSRD
jgi:hypothetical protein